MRRVVLLALLALALPVAAAADTFDYANLGTVSGGTATINASVKSGGWVDLSSQLTNITDQSTGVTVCNTAAACNGMVSVTTGTLSSCAAGLCFTGGTLTITSNGKTLFSGAFSGTVTTIGAFTYVSGTVGNIAGSTQVVFKIGSASQGNISGDTIVTPEPGTLGLLGTGLIGLAGIVRRKLRG